MTKLIPRDAAIEVAQRYTATHDDAFVANDLRAIPTIDPAAIREAAL